MTETETVATSDATLNNSDAPTQDAPELVVPEAEPNAGEQAQETQSPPKDDADKMRRSMQRRIDKRTADLYAARAEKDQLAQRLAAIEARLQGTTEQEAPAVDPVALAREIATVERITERSNNVARDGEKRFSGEFRVALATVRDEAGELFHPSGKPTALGEAILDAEDPAGLLHYIGTNPDIASELQGLSAAAIGRRIGRIEAQMSAKPRQASSNAPRPHTPVKAAGGGPKDPATMSDAEFAAWRREQIKARS